MKFYKSLGLLACIVATTDCARRQEDHSMHSRQFSSVDPATVPWREAPLLSKENLHSDAVGGLSDWNWCGLATVPGRRRYPEAHTPACPRDVYTARQAHNKSRHIRSRNVRAVPRGRDHLSWRDGGPRCRRSVSSGTSHWTLQFTNQPSATKPSPR